ncbi:MAG: hypothetical protein COT85_05950 [Chlamydiae bacterium CG10_big_fil_rev_8_21_14_0_10_42_34]|nr:MAG: hypothetical protein COT85_05950 [Chlamydiae bacterium CG10_big_fil_rev_8_21_14_0_10_42_34]
MSFSFNIVPWGNNRAKDPQEILSDLSSQKLSTCAKVLSVCIPVFGWAYLLYHSYKRSCALKLLAAKIDNKEIDGKLNAKVLQVLDKNGVEVPVFREAKKYFGDSLFNELLEKIDHPDFNVYVELAGDLDEEEIGSMPRFLEMISESRQECFSQGFDLNMLKFAHKLFQSLNDGIDHSKCEPVQAFINLMNKLFGVLKIGKRASFNKQSPGLMLLWIVKFISANWSHQKYPELSKEEKAQLFKVGIEKSSNPDDLSINIEKEYKNYLNAKELFHRNTPESELTEAMKKDVIFRMYKLISSKESEQKVSVRQLDLPGTTGEHVAKAAHEKIVQKEYSYGVDEAQPMFQSCLYSIVRDQGECVSEIVEKLFPPGLSSFHVEMDKDNRFHKFSMEFSNEQKTTITDVAEDGFKPAEGVKISCKQKVTGEIDYEGRKIKFGNGQLIATKVLSTWPIEFEKTFPLKSIDFSQYGAIKLEVATGFLGDQTIEWPTELLMRTIEKITW